MRRMHRLPTTTCCLNDRSSPAESAIPERPSVSKSTLRTLPGLLTPSHAYKPFRYPWAYDFWKKQQQVHWMPEEIPLGEDLKDWATNLNDNERNLLTQIFRFFTQSDVCLLYT